MIFVGLLVSCRTAIPLSPALTSAQVDALATEALKYTPEHTHFAEGTRFDWVLFSGPKNDDFPEVTRSIASKLSSRYRVYGPDDELPRELQVESEMGRSYKDGFLYTVEARKISPTTIAVSYSDYEGPLAAGRQTITYRWNGRAWKIVNKGELWVS